MMVRSNYKDVPSPKGWWLHDNDKEFHHQKDDGDIEMTSNIVITKRMMDILKKDDDKY